MCSKCAVISRFGTLSCCAPNASWYQNCGRNGDPNFSHTWEDGFKACKYAAKLSLLTTAMNQEEATVVQTGTVQTIIEREIMVAASSPVCPRCAMVKRSGKLSCCARSGSWYKNCARTSDSAFEHTWNEGLAACRHAEMSPVAAIRVKQALVKEGSTSQRIDVVQNQTNHAFVTSTGSFVTTTHDTVVVSCRSYDQLSHTCICICLLMFLRV